MSNICENCNSTGLCEDCGEPAVGFNDAGGALCEDCLVEWANAEIVALAAIGAYD